MNHEKWKKYSALGEESNTTSLQSFLDHQEDSSSSSQGRLYEEDINPQKTSHKPYKVHLLWFIFYVFGNFFSIWLGWSVHKAPSSIDSPWDSVNDAIRYQEVVTIPHFGNDPTSPYIGKPNASIDALWYNLSQLYNFAVDYKTLTEVNKTKGAVQWPGTSKYQAGLMAFHHLHCLNIIRMHGEEDYYSKVDFDMMNESLEERRKHKDHCVDMLRQHIECKPDLTPYTYHWAAGTNMPFADLRVKHQCVDWGHFQAWANKEAVASKPLLKPAGAEEAA